MYWVISTKHLHKVAPTMNSLRRNSTKPSEEAGRLQYLVHIGFDTQITKRNLTVEDRAELYTIYQESFDKCYIPKDWKRHRERSPQDEWVLHPHNAKHCWEAHGTLCCQETCQRPQGQGDTLCKWGGGGGGGGVLTRKMHVGKMQLHLHMMCTKDCRGKNKQWLWQLISRMLTTESSLSCWWTCSFNMET